MKKSTSKSFGARTARNAIAVAALICVGVTAQAQSSEGSVYGKGPATAQVTMTSVDTGQTRTATTTADGIFSLRASRRAGTASRLPV